MDPGLEIELIDTFVDSTKGELEKLESAILANDSKHSEIYAHSIKGASKYVGAMKVAARGFDLEQLSKAGKLDEVRRKYPAFKEEIRLTSEVLNKYKLTLSN
eukprot:TRINITY_DN2793_c0_g1_i1.p1 TRINITY_DN2793_c0_g1~~TRINITY_DN2793_c0_g1_i1.p1  ORF type:complete len:102 (+),score=21.36 TRINITY_DN2793_c0_g1_i1:349-654(+)